MMLALALTATAGLWWWSSRPASQPAAVVVARADIESSITATGTLQPVRYVDVGAQVSGTIERLHVQPGDTVSKGQRLVQLNAGVQQAVVDAGRAAMADLRAQLVEARAQHRLASRQFARQRLLAAEEATRAEEVQLAEAAHEGALARIAQLEARLAQTQASQRAEDTRLSHARIDAPMAGTVISVEPREGQTLNAAYQTPHIMRIADLSAMTVWVEVSEADVQAVKAGMPAYFTTLAQAQGVPDLPGAGTAAPRRWEGRVRQVLPAPPPADRRAGETVSASDASAGRVVVYTALFDVDNADGALLPRMTAQVSFVAARARDALALPLTALTPTPGQPGVFQVRVLGEGGKVETRRVLAGVNDGVRVQILEGLAEGERVLIGARS